MDIFKGIGDFFGGLFGQKKKREDEQPQPQQQQSAVSFNSTPKLGDNFANNSSNPTQPQQPKEFAKSSVDLNPVKPVQPVQPQPQVNRDQERQQLANKYRQEETDRYNQGSDHAANFLNDIFSGGKTAQMRENTINQNIQNRVNAEMLRKYGPDDQQVKQNIAQTSQDINNKATSVNDFTKNYNNTVQQTVASPVSAVKGAANSVVETMPKVSGAVTELGANTIKLFDEDNQFANNLINRVRADREKNIVRKTLNSTTGLTDQDNKMAYGLGSSGTRMAIDAAMTSVTGGVAPALVHGVEAHSEMMDSLDNIEARKKAEAAAKGEAYTPSSFTSRYLAATANAGAQAAIEKLGIDNVTGKIGGKFAKNMVGRAVTGALGEAGEEAAQQYAENFTKKLFDNKQNIHEGVAESALMGGIMGGAGKMAFGGMNSVKNPYKSNDMADGEVSISKTRPEQMGDVISSMQKNNAKRNAYYNPKASYEAEMNATIPPREKITLADAEMQNRGGDLQYSPKRETNIGRLDSDQLGFTKDELVGKFTGDTRKRMSERSFNMLQDLRANNPYVTGDGDSVNLSRIGNSKMTHSGATVPNDLFIAKMRTTPRIGEILANAQKTHSAPDVKNHGIAPDGFNYYDSPVRISGKNYIQSFDVGVDKPRNKNTVYNSTIKETPELLSYEAKRNDTESNSDVYNSNIAQDPQNVNTYSKDSVNRSGFANPYAQNNQHTTFVNDRDSGSIFGDGFDPRGRNGSVNKDGGFGIEIKHNLNPDNYQLTDSPELNHELVRLMEETFDRTVGLNTTKQNVVANFYDDPDFESALEAKERWYEDLDPDVEEQIWEDILKDRGYDLDYESNDEGLLRKKDDYMDYERINEMLENAADDVQRGHDESNSLAAGPIISRYPRVLDEQIRLADHSNGRSNDYEVRYSEDDLRNKRISSQDIKRDLLDEITRLVEDKRDSLGEFTNVFNEGGLAEGVEYLVDNLPHTEADPNNPYRFTVYGREVDLSRFKGETDAEVIANDATDQILEALTEERDDVDYQNVNDNTLNNAQNINSLYGITTKENTGTSNFRENSSTGSYSDVSGDSLAQNDRDVNGSVLNDARNDTLYGGLTKEKNHSGGLNAAPGELVLPGQSDSYDSNIAQKVNDFNREYKPEIQDLQNAYQKYGDDFEFNLTPEQQAVYEHLLRESPRDSEGRYIDPATSEVTIDQIAQDSKGDLAETGQKTRKFAETVLDTDTPPKDFVKLMHAGDESLKYTPKKNSEMWSRATKSVQESPERVFNELENTRVANDETMAKGIALAKHYQAMGDDLKASELYVELAKKATEAGRTVQALNLMRRTTPEGVLMSTMREVENYNDKMKNKPNKQINITPEQRAEFLGRLREAYAMPEGN